jgi:protoheme IX farnesyltransferase
MFAAYLNLTKPRMVLGNAIVAVAAFVFGSPTTFNWPEFMLMSAGIWLVMSSACALNNYYDRAILPWEPQRLLPAVLLLTW